MELISLFQDNSKGEFISHLSPTTTMSPIAGENTQKSNNNDYEFQIFAVNSNITNDDTHQNTSKESEGLVILEISAIMVLIMICGVSYALWKYFLDRKHAQREMDMLITPPLLTSSTTSQVETALTILPKNTQFQQTIMHPSVTHNNYMKQP